MQKRPFTVKGKNITTPKGKALWCHNIEPQRKFNDKGDLTTNLVLDPNDKEVKEFISTLEEIRDAAYNETVETLGEAKAKAVKKRPVFIEDTDQDGNDTGNIIVKLKLKDVDEKKEEGRQFEIFTVDAKKNKIEHPPRIGNGSVIRCAGFANPYYMASTKEVGISIIWTKVQIIDLVEIDGGDSFGEEDGFEMSETGELEVPF